MRRRDFLLRMAGPAVAWPFAARAQQVTTPVVGYLCSTNPDQQVPMTRAYLQGLGETGFVEGRNVIIEYRWASGHYDQLPTMVADLISRRVSVIDAVAGSAPGPGITRLGTTVEPRRLELLHELVPTAPAISFLVNPTNPAEDSQLQRGAVCGEIAWPEARGDEG